MVGHEVCGRLCASCVCCEEVALMGYSSTLRRCNPAPRYRAKHVLVCAVCAVFDQL